MTTQINEFIGDIIDEVRLTEFVVSKGWDTNAPFYFYGTPIEINKELSRFKRGSKKFPAIFLLEPFTVNENDDMMLNVGASPSINLYFMSNYATRLDWDTEEHYENIIKDMESLKNEFIRNLKANKFVLNIDSYDTVRHANWGLFINNKGNKEPVFDEKLSGIELSIQFDIDKLIEGCNLFK